MRKTWWCGCPSRPSPATRVILSVCVVQGMLLDLDAATLTVWINGERKRVMVRPGMTTGRGRPMARLEGPLRWVAEMNGAVEIAHGQPPAGS